MNINNVAGILFKYRGIIPLPFIAVMLYYFNGNEFSMLAGFSILAIGEIIRIWGVSYAGEITRTTSRLRAESLITAGPFSFIRNPLYFGNILILGGFSIFSMALFPYLQAATILWFIVQYRIIIEIEEEFLEERFGKQYLNYKKVVPRFFPNMNPNSQLFKSDKEPDYHNALKSEARTFQALFSVGLISLIIYLVK